VAIKERNRDFAMARIRKVKPTVGLTHFFGLMNLCEKTRVSANVYRGLVLSKKTGFWRIGQKEFSLQTKSVVFLLLDPNFGPLFRRDFHAYS
jgi:hypothetical protein